MLPHDSRWERPRQALRALILPVWHAWSLALLAAGTLALWQQRTRERRQLAALGDDLLKDLGLDRERVARECAKPFWRP